MAKYGKLCRPDPALALPPVPQRTQVSWEGAPGWTHTEAVGCPGLADGPPPPPPAVMLSWVLPASAVRLGDGVAGGMLPVPDPASGQVLPATVVPWPLDGWATQAGAQEGGGLQRPCLSKAPPHLIPLRRRCPGPPRHPCGSKPSGPACRGGWFYRAPPPATRGIGKQREKAPDTCEP